jgi:hypothetical protein
MGEIDGSDSSSERLSEVEADGIPDCANQMGPDEDEEGWGTDRCEESVSDESEGDSDPDSQDGPPGRGPGDEAAGKSRRFWQDEPQSDDDDRNGDDDGDDLGASQGSSTLTIFDPRQRTQKVITEYFETLITVVHDQFSYYEGGELHTIDTSTGSIRTEGVKDVIEVAGNTEDTTFVLTKRNEVVLVSVYDGPRSICSWDEGRLSKLTAGHSNDPIFAARSGKTLIIGSEGGHQPIELKGDIVDIALSDRYLYVSTDEFLTFFDTTREIGSYGRPSGIKSFCLLDGEERLLVWGGRELDIIDIRTSGTLCQRYDLGYVIESVDLTIYPKLLAITGGESVSVVDWRSPLDVVTRIDCSGRHSEDLQAKWIQDTSILVIASGSGLPEFHDLRSYRKRAIDFYLEGAKAGMGMGLGMGLGMGMRRGAGQGKAKEVFTCDAGPLIGLETNSEWAFVHKRGSLTCIQNEDDWIHRNEVRPFRRW